MLYCYLHESCGFGNLLFIISTGLALSYKYMTNVYFIDYTTIRLDRPNIKIYDIFKSLNYINSYPLNIIKIKETKEFFYNEIIIDNNNNYLLYGYFQSYKYFSDYIDKIKKNLFDNINDIVNDMKNKFNLLKENKKTILIHVRRGDYLNSDMFPKLDEDYYEKRIYDFFIKNNK